MHLPFVMGVSTLLVLMTFLGGCPRSDADATALADCQTELSDCKRQLTNSTIMVESPPGTGSTAETNGTQESAGQEVAPPLSATLRDACDRWMPEIPERLSAALVVRRNGNPKVEALAGILLLTFLGRENAGVRDNSDEIACIAACVDEVYSEHGDRWIRYLERKED